MEKQSILSSPGWALAGGCCLAFLAAGVNADFMLRMGVSVSHLTGDLSRVTAGTVRSGSDGSQEALRLCLSLAGFVGGAATSGFFVHHPDFQLKRPYGRSVIFIGILLLATIPLSRSLPTLTCGMAAWACGMQNALATRYRGLILRTTHITGLLTDLGQHIGMKLRGHRIEFWKLLVPSLLAISFCAGAMIGAVISLATQVPVTLACGLTYLLIGLGWTILKRR